MFGYTRIDASRFSLKDRKFLRLYFIESRPRETVSELMGLQKSQFYNYYNKVSDCIERDYRRYKIRNPHFNRPERMALIENKEEPIGEGDLAEAEQLTEAQLLYTETTGKELPNRYKNDTQRILQHIKQYDGISS